MRWRISNAVGHLFEVAYKEKNQELAECCLQDLLQDLYGNDWGSKYRADAAMRPYLARFAILKGDWETAVRCFEDFLGPEHRPSVSEREALAREYLDFGLALAGSRRKERAIAAWRRGLECSDVLGNKLWKDKIHAVMKEHETLSD